MSLRQRIWIDARIQGVLVGRIVFYWLATVAFFGVGIAVTQYCDHSDWTFAEHTRHWIGKTGPWIPSAFLLLPLVIYDIVRTSHAFAGPVNRARQQLNKLLQNPNCTPLVLRQDDFLQDLTGPINSLQHQVLSLHMALQKQRELIDQLRSGNTSASDNVEIDSGIPNVAQIPKEDLETAQLMESMTAAS